MDGSKLNRRRFIKSSSLGILGTGMLNKSAFAHNPQDHINELSKIKEYRTLGRTGFKVSDIGIGRPRPEGLIKAAIDAGINYLDSAQNYGSSETEIGKAIQNFDRESLFITTKIHRRKLVELDTEGVLNSAYESLERLQTDYIDCLQFQGAESLDDVKHEGFHNAVKQLQKEGKVRFAGLSCHGKYFAGNPTDSMKNIMISGIDDGRFDVLLFVYNFVNSEQGERILEKAADKNIGTTIMKTNPVRIYNMLLQYKDDLSDRYLGEFEKYENYANQANDYLVQNNISDADKEFRDIATKFILSNENAHCALIDFQNFTGLEEHLIYSGSRLDVADYTRMNGLRNIVSRIYCRHACGICEPACPNNVPVNTIMRYNYYYTVKGEQKYAIQKYKELHGRKPDVCINCEGFCEKSCPYGVLTRPLLAIAHQNLSFQNLLFT